MYPDPVFLQQEARGRMAEVLEVWEKDRMAVGAEKLLGRERRRFGRLWADPLHRLPLLGRALQARHAGRSV